MILYLDSSALVKLYVAQPESEQVRRLIARVKLVCNPAAFRFLAFDAALAAAAAVLGLAAP
jgi:predicted nucleic acid-binding protein